MSDNGTESKNKTRKQSFWKFIGVILPILLIAAFALFIFFLRMFYPAADETIIRTEAARVLFDDPEDLTEDELNIREAAAMAAQKDPNDLTDKDFAKIKKLTLKGSTRDINLLEKFTNLERLSIDGKQLSCIEFIKDLPNLQILDLVGYNPIDLEPLKQLTNVKIIQINSEYIKAEQIQELEKALPKTEIHHMFIH